MVALPTASAAGVKLSVPVEDTAGATANRAALVLLTMLNVSVWLSSGSPSSMFVAQLLTLAAPLSSATVTSGPLVNDGVSFTAFTVISKVWLGEVSSPPLAVPPLSDRLTVTVALPLALAAGVNVNCPVAPMLGWLANRPLLSLETLKLRVCDVSGSPSLMLVAQAFSV